MASTFGLAFFKAEEAAKPPLPESGTVLITVNPLDRKGILPPARKFQELGFRILATEGTCHFLTDNGVQAEMIAKVSEGRPDIIDVIKNGEIQLVINTPIGKASAKDDSYIRKNAIRYGVPYITTVAAAVATANGVAARRQGHDTLKSLQEYHAGIK
jgi:carbamoyl-phosphate synthase large subunit